MLRPLRIGMLTNSPSFGSRLAPIVRTLSRQTVGVGIMVTHDPLHGSGRAGLPHPALALGSDAKAVQRIWMIGAQRGQVAVNEPPHAVPFDPALLTAARQRTLPEPAHLRAKQEERRHIERDSVVSHVP